MTVPDGPHEVGAVVPVRVEVRNVSARPLWAVGVLDGSEAGYRHPVYTPSVEGPRPVPPQEADGCGNVAPLRIEDFRLLAPGEGFDPTRGPNYLPLLAFANFAPAHPGRYELRLTLSTESDNAEDWLGMIGYPGEEAVVERLKEVPRLRAESAPVVVEVS
ncbi:MAG TPA: hypothetical protein VG148_06565 [Pyrinomonadaceae bacterium]|nr:hypothetical protein [Pyrinomonadaceae bacterium]